LVKFNHSSKYFNLFFIQKKGYIPLFKVLACISPGITRVIHLIKNLFRIDFIYIIKSIITVLMSHTQFNHRSWIRNSTQLLLTLAWLNLRDKHMTTVRIKRINKMSPFFFSFIFYPCLFDPFFFFFFYILTKIFYLNL
jgi:hypothetical protein